MCHMFLVPVFETGSLETFQLSPHTKVEGVEEDTQKQRNKEGKKMAGIRDRWLETEDGWTDR